MVDQEACSAIRWSSRASTMLGVFEVKKEIRVSIRTHPISRAENRRRIYVSFADFASLDGDGGAEHRIGCRAGRGCGQHPAFTGKVSDAMCGAKHTEGG